jgi:transcriptional regulator with PAS, ATPase and Fis domain
MGHVFIRNNGFSKCYHQYDLKIRLCDDEGNVYALNDRYPDSTHWEREETAEEVFRLNYKKVPEGSYHVELGLFEGERPIKLAVKQECLRPDGYYRLSQVKVEAL